MLHSLNTAQTGLNTSKVQVENVMNNIANENTDGYKTRNVNTEEAKNIDDRLAGRGSSVIDVTRVTNMYMYENILQEDARAASFSELNTMLDEVEGIFKETDESGLSYDLEKFFTAMENLRLSPQNEIYRNDLINTGNILVDGIKNLYSQVESLETEVKAKLEDHVSEVNNILGQIGAINDEMRQKHYATNDMLDKRDALEQELTAYTDVSIIHTSVESYNLQIGGESAVRFYNNVHTMSVGEEYTPQRDVYGEFNASGQYVSSLIDTTTWGTLNQNTAEEQSVALSGLADAPVYFLGSLVGNVGDDPATVVAAIAAHPTLINDWNTANPDREIATITAGAGGTTLDIVYETTEGNVETLPSVESGGINFSKSNEDVKGVLDGITYNFNNTTSITVHYGEQIDIDTTGDGEPDTTINVDETNIVRAMVAKINSTDGIKEYVTAYNGQYSYDEDGEIVRKDSTKDQYLVIESNSVGDKGKFKGEIVVADEAAGAALVTDARVVVEKDGLRSKEGADEVYMQLFDKKIDVTQGEFAPIVDNLSTADPNNKIIQYKSMLDTFVDTFVDMFSEYIELDEGEYVYGKDAVSIHEDFDKKVSIGLFEGSTVDSLVFNDKMVYTLNQEKLDYMTQARWKDDIDFGGEGEHIASFSQYYQSIRVTIAQDNELVMQRKENQSAVQESLQNTYDKLVKVDKDEEMVNLIKFQAAYEANAKMITVVDEMLQTILGLKS